MTFVKEYVQKRTSKNVFFRQVNTLITLSRFRGELTTKKAYEPNSKKINSQLRTHKVMVHQGEVKIDDSNSFRNKII